MLCHQCGSQVAKDAEECPNCGAELVKSVRRFDIATSKGLRISQELKAIKLDNQLFPPGEEIADRFELGEMIGRGPFGEVYRAHDNEIDTDACIKIFDEDVISTPLAQEEFLGATRAARSLSQPNLARIHDSGVHKDHPWVSMQFLEGLTLRKVMRLRQTKGETFELEETLPTIEQVAAALDVLPGGQPHGNLKPENIFFLPDLIKVTDSYLYSALSKEVVTKRLDESVYFAPELHTPESQADARSDVYSMGVILGEMLFGPDYTPGSEARGELAAVDALCKRATAFDPNERYPTVSELHEELATLLETGALLTPPATPPPAPGPGASAPPPAPMAPTETDTLELEVDDDAIEFEEVDDDLVVSEVSAEDEKATVEYDRDIDPEIQDLLPTTEVERDSQIPPPEPRRNQVTATKISKTDDDDSGSGKWVAIAAVFLVAIVLAFAYSNNKTKKKEVVTIGGKRDAGEVAKVVDAGSGKDVGALAQASDTGSDAGPSPQLLAALTEAAKPVSSSFDSAVTKANEEGAKLAEEEEEKEETGDAEKNVGAVASKTGSSKPAEAQKPTATAGTECPGGMRLVKSKSGNYCIDVFEYPARGVEPKTRVNWFEAKRLCTSKGKRLCKLEEWRGACGSRYPYGGRFDATKCNTVDEDGFERSLAKAGSFKSCRSRRSGAYDMTGNVHEWVEERRIAGGSYESDEDVASCRYSSPKAPGSSAGDIGFRCCATPE